MRALALAPVLWLGPWGCGSAAPPAAPTLQLPFSSSAATPVLFNGDQGVVAGTLGLFAFGVLNAGTEALSVQGVTYAGSPAMALEPLAPPLPVTLAFNGELILQLACTPPAAESYAGTVSILSNAANTPDAMVYLSCVGMSDVSRCSGRCPP